LKPKNKGGGASSTQKYVDADEIRDGVIVMKSGALRAVVLVSSLNFDLKSTEEQDAIIQQYQQFFELARLSCPNCHQFAPFQHRAIPEPPCG